MDNSTNSISFLNFMTFGTWSASDVISLVSSTSGLFDAFLALDVQTRHADEYFKMIERTMEKAYKYMDHPMYHELYHLWREYLHMWRREKIGMPILPPFLFPFQFEQIHPEATVSSYQIFEDIDSYVSDEERLQVKKIHIASPGSFSFTGSGEIIREIRELIKDFWYRNKQEKVKGELEIIEKYLNIRRQNEELNLPPPTRRRDFKLVKVIQEKLRALRRLEDNGKLRSIPENIDIENE